MDALRERQARRQREGKTRRLDALCEDYGSERKQAIKLLGDAVPAPSGRAQPDPAPRAERLEPVVRTIWLAAEPPCGKRLAPALPLWLPHSQRLHANSVSGSGNSCARSVPPPSTGCWRRRAPGIRCAAAAALPFALLGFDCDNGSEFLNHHLLGYLHQRKKPVACTRSRPYHSDDNAHVEQKNWMWPRQLLGYGRLEREELVVLASAL